MTKQFFMLTACVLFASCSTYRESVSALENVHREPVNRLVVSRSSKMPVMEYCPFAVVRGENIAVEDPAGFCMEEIGKLAEYEYESDLDMSEAVYILCKTARRSPSQLVRATALKALRKILGNDAHVYIPSHVIVGHEKLEAILNTLRPRFVESEGNRETAAETDEEYLAGIRRLGEISFSKADAAWKIIQMVFVNWAPLEKNSTAKTALEDAAARVNLNCFYLTTMESMTDPGGIVCAEAIENLFLFPWEATAMFVSAFLEADIYWNSPQCSIAILEKIEEFADSPEEIGLEVLTQVASLTSPMHAGVSYGVNYHALAVLKKATGIDKDDTEFWQKWCYDYRVKHAGEERKGADIR